jgi:hypothetical protein
MVEKLADAGSASGVRVQAPDRQCGHQRKWQPRKAVVRPAALTRRN